MYTVHETGNAAPLAPTCGPWGAWGSVFLRSNGVELDNIQMYSREHQLHGWLHLSQAEQFGEAGLCGCGGSFVAGASTLVPAMGTIAAGASYTVMRKMHLCAFNSRHYWPTRYAPLELEMSLNPVVTDWLSPTFAGAAASQTFEI